MNFNDFLNKTLIQENSGTSVENRPSKKNLGYERMYNILLNNEKFEGEINTPEEFRAVIDALLRDVFKINSAIKKQAKEVDKIIKKIENGDTISDTEEEMADDFADKVEDYLFSETYIKGYTAKSKGGSGGQANKDRFSSSIPVKFIADNKKEYYGLITPPTGYIAWQSKSVHSIVKNDPDLKIPGRLELIKDGWKVLKNSFFNDLIKSRRLIVRDDDRSKKKVEEIFTKHGASINQKGELPGIEKVVKKIEFWKDIAKIF